MMVALRLRTLRLRTVQPRTVRLRTLFLQTAATSGVALVILLGAFLFSALFTAQMTAQTPAGQPQQEGQGKAKQQINQLKKLKLLEDLDLDEATAEKFLVRYTAEQKKVEDARKALDDAMRDLDKASHSSTQNAEQVKQLTENALKKHSTLQTTTTDMLQGLRSLLSEQQYGKFMVFESKFQEQVRKALLEIKRDNKGK